jgi:LacI family transcriptional regulator
MIDVAKQAGVSLKTVSRVINNEPHVQDKLRDRVLTSIKQLGYVPSASARSLRSHRTYSLHMISDTIEGNFINTIQSGAQLASQKHGYNLLVTLLSLEVLEDPNALKTWCEDFVSQNRPDGVILIPPHSDNLELNAYLSAAGIPISRIGPNQIQDVNNCTVMIDDRTAALEITKYLIGLGHTRIGFIRGQESQGATHERFSGYCEALDNANITLDPNLVKPGDFTFETGMQAGQEFLDMSPRPTAIFASNDNMAAGVIIASHMRNVKVPDELSVFGFDDSELAEHIWPTMSTVRQPVRGYGAQAVESLVSKAGNRAKSSEDRPSIVELMDYTFIVRGSTGPVDPKNT